jgi:hypothetical protein
MDETYEQDITYLEYGKEREEMAAIAEILGSICIGLWSYFTEKYEKHISKNN